MKKEVLLTAVVFLGVGFLAGMIYDAHRHWSSGQAPETGGGVSPQRETPAGGAALGGTMPGLPEGHPPINDAVLVRALEQQAAQNPNDPEPRLKLANFYFDQREFERAVEWYQKGLELDPKNVDARTDLGTAYFNLGRPDLALAEYRRSLEINPTHEPTLFNLIVVKLKGKHDRAAARAAWEKLHKRNPNYPGLDRMRESLDAGESAPP